MVAQLLHLEAVDPGVDLAARAVDVQRDVLVGLAIYDTMQFIKPEVQTIC